MRILLVALYMGTFIYNKLLLKYYVHAHILCLLKQARKYDDENVAGCYCMIYVMRMIHTGFIEGWLHIVEL